MNSTGDSADFRRAQYERVFRRESEFLNLAQGPTATQPSYDDVVGHFAALLRQAVRLVQTGDAIERQLQEAQATVQAERDSAQALNRRLTEVIRQKDQFIGVTSHDLRSPLAALLSLVQLLLEDDDYFDADARRDLLSTGRDSIERMLGLVNRLLELNQMERGLHRVKTALLDLAETAQGQYRVHGPRAAQKDIRLILHVGEPIPPFLSSPENVERIVDNFLSNAVKYSPCGSTVTLGIGRHPVNNNPCLWVQDQGPGLTDNDRQRLFRPFERLSAQPTGGESSSGLGLAIAKALADEISAEILVDSSPGHGARFTLRFSKTSADNFTV